MFDKKASKWNKVYRDLFLVSGINYSKLKLFVLSNLWMVSISNTIQRAEPTSLGMHEDTIRQMLLNETPGPKELYAVLFRKIKEKIGTGLMLADAIKQRLEGHTCYYMVFGGYAWYVIVTSHKLNQTIHRAILSEKGEALVSLMPIKETGAVEAVKHVHSVK
ncbi:MAG: hypothetical protein KQH53_09055 [Desulfarculaceae bacterium]|nr:hypothetical protein [Desulfarculaceae bacterium]